MSKVTSIATRKSRPESPSGSPPDQAERSRALDPERSFLVQAPAGSGKTHLLTQRFLRLLAQAEKPDEIVAITFTNAAAAEMRNRILAELEKAELDESEVTGGESLPALARRALGHAKRMGWQILDQPSQLRITTIDAFCRGLALQSPLGWGLLSGMGGQLDLVENPQELYRRAARQTIEVLRKGDSPERRSIEALLLWRDNNWKDVEDQIVEMLGARNRWYQDFVFARTVDWDALRLRLESAFLRGARKQLHSLCGKLDRLDGCREFALKLAKLACEEEGSQSPKSLAARSELHLPPFADHVIEDATKAYAELATFLLTKEGGWRSEHGLNKKHGFPATPRGRSHKGRFGEFVGEMRKEPGLLDALAGFLKSIPLRYSDEEWVLVRHCFVVLKAAAVELQLAFAERGAVDFTEVSQIALRILAPDENGFPSDFAQQQAASIRHLLVDEFQDTSRNQHQLLSRLIAAWPEREGRSCFCVGDPMQSIYGFREAEVELFERLKTHGLDVEGSEPFRFEFVPLRANFRTAASLVEDLNSHFEQIFAEDDGSGVQFSPAVAARVSDSSKRVELHLNFKGPKPRNSAEPGPSDPDETRKAQMDEIVALVQTHLPRIAQLRSASNGDEGKYRIAILGRTKKSLIDVADALREASIGFRAIDLVPLRERSEVLDALALARALLNPTDRVAWLGVLRAPWCGLSLEDLHTLTSADTTEVIATAIPKLLTTRFQELVEQGLLSAHGQSAIERVASVLRQAMDDRSSIAGTSQGSTSQSKTSRSTTSLGTWLESVWKQLGGEDTVNEEQRQNLSLLWSALDKLPNGEVDLLGAGLDAALEKLCALPDPAASSDFGVQLMTIHKSKGLEFEVVIVPDLQARSRATSSTMLSWLERGLASREAVESGELTELLIAPFQPKGQDPGLAKKWVDGIKVQREVQEIRRVLYVAATRAREELHLFARPSFTIDKNGEARLSNPSSSLLATAWPAVSEKVADAFAEWSVRLAPAVPGKIEELAATGTEPRPETMILQMPTPVAARSTLLKRLPADYSGPSPRHRNAPAPDSPAVLDPLSDADRLEALYSRTAGGLYSRVEGSAIHTLLDRISRLRVSMDAPQAALAVESALAAVTATIRSYGIPLAQARRIGARALEIARSVAADPVGAWILSPHSGAVSEARWTARIRDRQWNLRPDRIFFDSNLEDETPSGSASWWIIDYKSSRADEATSGDLSAFLERHRVQHKEQLDAYAQALRNLISPTEPVRLGIYYPRLLKLDSWESGS